LLGVPQDNLAFVPPGNPANDGLIRKTKPASSDDSEKLFRTSVRKFRINTKASESSRSANRSDLFDNEKLFSQKKNHYDMDK